MGQWPDELDARSDPEVVHLVTELSELSFPARPRRPADDEQRRLGMTFMDERQGSNGDIDPFERLDAADKNEHRARTQSQPPAGASLRAGSENTVIDAGRRSAKPAGVGAVELEQLGGLRGGGGHDAIRRRDDFMFGRNAYEAFGSVVWAEAVILDPAQGVERVGQWNSQGRA